MTKAEREPVSSVTWEDPAPPLRRYDWTAIAEQLRSRPGEWAKVFEEDKTSLVNAIRQGAVTSLDPILGFEVRTRNNKRAPDRRCSLYMRWSEPDPDMVDRVLKEREVRKQAEAERRDNE